MEYYQNFRIQSMAVEFFVILTDVFANDDQTLILWPKSTQCILWVTGVGQ